MLTVPIRGHRSPKGHSCAAQNPSQRFYWGLFITWMIGLSLIAAHHEFWRDEVRALSLSIQASSLTDLLHSLQDEGHPMLWYLLLYGGFAATGSVLVLPLLSLIIAVAAVYLLIFLSPFSRWIKTLFAFSGLPLYEYSVMARNYGISMLLLFAFAAMYRLRKRHALLMGLILAALSNTNIHSLLLAFLLMLLWSWDTLIVERYPLWGTEARDLYKALAIVFVGGAGALYAVWPTGNMIASDTDRYTVVNIMRAVETAVVTPAKQFGELFPSFIPMKIRIVLLLGALLGLMVRPPVFLVAFAALVALSVLFSVVYSSWYRHQGLLIIFLISLYWIVLEYEGETLRHKRLYGLFMGGLYCGMGALLVVMVLSGATKIHEEWIFQKSASRALAQELLHSRREFKDAILIGEPDYILEAVPYYADNRIYIAREKRFGYTVKFLRSVQLQLSMSELLCTAWRIQMESKKPVLIVLGHRFLGLDHMGSGQPPFFANYFYQRTFSWSPEALDAWKLHTRLEQQFDTNVIGDEAYTVYSLAPTESSLHSICR